MKSHSSICLMLCVVLAFWHTNSTASEQVVISKNTYHIDLKDKIEWLIADKNKQLSDVQNLQDWQPNFTPIKIDQSKNLWGKFTITFNDTDDEQYFLTVGNPHLDYVDIFLLDEKERILGSYLMGGNRDYAKRPYRHRLFIAPINLAKSVM